MERLKVPLWVSVLWLATLLLIISSSVEAEVMMRIDQPKVRLSVPPGRAQEGTIRVENPSGEEVKVRVYVEDWVYTPAQDGTKVFKPPGTTPLSCARWISFHPAEFTVPPYGRQVVSYTIDVPLGAKGGHYAVLFFETLLGEMAGEEGVRVLIAGRIGSLFYIEPLGTIEREARIGNLSLTREGKDEPLEIEIDFKNIGNVEITTKAAFNIIDREGLVFARAESNEVYTLPDDEARLLARWPEDIPAGIYDLVITLDLGGLEPLVKEAQIKVTPLGRIERIRLKE